MNDQVSSIPEGTPCESEERASIGLCADPSLTNLDHITTMTDKFLLKNNQQELHKSRLAAKCDLLNNATSFNGNLQHTTGPKDGADQGSYSSPDGVVVSTEKGMEDEKRLIVAVVGPDSSNLSSIDSSHAHLGEYSASTISSKAEMPILGASVPVSSMFDENCKTREDVLESASMNMLQCSSFFSNEMNHPNTEAKDYITPMNKPKLIKRQALELQRLESLGMRQSSNQHVCAKVVEKNSKQSNAEKMQLTDWKSGCSMPHLNEPMDQNQAGCEANHNELSPPSVLHSPQGQLCPESANCSKSDWESRGEFGSFMDGSLSQDYECQSLHLDSAWDASHKYDQLNQEDMMARPEEKEIALSKKEANHVLSGNDSASRIKEKSCSMGFSKEDDIPGRTILKVSSVEEPGTMRREFYGLETLNVKKPSGGSAGPASSCNPESNERSVIGSDLSMTENSGLSKSKDRCLLESSVENGIQMSQMRMPLARKATANLEKGFQTWSARVPECDLLNLLQPGHHKDAESLQIANQSSSYLKEQRSNRADRKGSARGMPSAAITPHELSILPGTGSNKIQNSYFKKSKGRLPDHFCHQIPLSASSTNKTKLSPYAPAYIRQGDPHPAHETIPMIAKWRPLNDILAKLQYSQARTPILANDSNISERCPGAQVWPEYRQPQVHPAPEVPTRLHSTGQSMVAASDWGRFDRAVVDHGGASSGKQILS